MGLDFRSKKLRERERERERERSGFGERKVVFVGLKSNKRVYLAFHFFKSL